MASTYYGPGSKIKLMDRCVDSFGKESKSGLYLLFGIIPHAHDALIDFANYHASLEFFL